MTMRISIDGIAYEASHPTKGIHGTTWMVSRIGKSGRALKATYAAREVGGVFRLGGRMF
jgi:hypothetical protein